MLYFSRLKAGMILCVCLIGILLSIPSLIPTDRLPAWYPHYHVNLGLDLQGGSYMLLEMDRAALLNARLESVREQAGAALKKAGIVASTRVAGGRVLIDVASPDAAARALADSVAEFGVDSVGRPALHLAHLPGGLAISYTDAGQATLLSEAVEQAIAIIRRRIDQTGANEPVVARQGEARILVELPGVSDPARLRRLLGSTAKMTFHLVASEAGANGAGVRRLPMIDNAAVNVPVLNHVEVDGANLIDAAPRQNEETGAWEVDFALDGVGARQFAQTTTQHVGEPFAILLDEEVVSAPVIRDPIIGGRGQISGGFTAEGARDLALLLRAGALPAPLSVVEERSVGATLGADAVHAGLVSIMVGLSLVMGFVIALYGRFGVYAAAALIINLALTIAGLALMNATLTLPGIAGLLLALGMAVDANILVNERTREELAKGKSVRASIEG
ncbi:MAG: protein translocase subunit SecD, partial [Sphingomonas sp.]